MGESMRELRETLCMELDEIAGKGELSMGDLDTVHKLTDTIKNIDKIENMEENGYSYGESYGDWRASGSYDMDRDRSDRGRSRGRYSRDNGYSTRSRHYVRGHYSYGDEDAMLEEKIEKMMEGGNLSLDDKSTLRKALEMMRR